MCGDNMKSITLTGSCSSCRANYGSSMVVLAEHLLNIGNDFNLCKYLMPGSALPRGAGHAGLARSIHALPDIITQKP